MLFSSHFRAELFLLGNRDLKSHRQKSQEHPFLSQEEVVAQQLVALRCAHDPVQALSVLGVSPNHSVTSVSPPSGTCKSEVIYIFLQQIWSHILLQTTYRPVNEGWPCSVEGSRYGTRL